MRFHWCLEYYAKPASGASCPRELPRPWQLPGFVDPELGCKCGRQVNVEIHEPDVMQLLHEALKTGHKGCALSNPPTQRFGTRRPVRCQVVCSKAGVCHQSPAVLPSLTKRELMRLAASVSVVLCAPAPAWALPGFQKVRVT
jgi:hypothetical protein